MSLALAKAAAAAASSTRPVLVGYSGGVDSTVLLHLLANRPATVAAGLRAIHVHHGLHRHADAWAAHCRAVCHALGVTLHVVRVNVSHEQSQGTEAAARAARHAAFAQMLGEDEVLALAHHLDDQAETFLLRALRNSGPDGLAAMRPWRAYARGWLWRPLLEVAHADLLAYARARQLHWIEDPSNQDTALDRNFLRQRVLPVLRERWPQAKAAFAQAAALQAEAVDLLEADDQAALSNAATTNPQVLRIAALLALPPGRRARVLRRWIVGLGLPALPANGVARIDTDLLEARADARAEFAWAGAVIRPWRGLLHAGLITPPLAIDWSAPWSLDRPLRLPTGDALRLAVATTVADDADADHALDTVDCKRATTCQSTTTTASVALPCRVHARAGGERIVLPGRSHSHALKHVLQDLGLPPWQRERLPLLSDAQGRLLAAADLVYSQAFDAWLRRRGARLIWDRHDIRA